MACVQVLLLHGMYVAAVHGEKRSDEVCSLVVEVDSR